MADVDTILVGGMGKTGTTGAYNAVRRALEEAGIAAHRLFEPTSVRPILGLMRHRPGEPILVKVMDVHVERVLAAVNFGHRIMLVRDPRDILISRLLFRPLTAKSIERLSGEGFGRFVAALETKEKDPSGLSVRQLHELADELGMSGSNWDRLPRALERLTHLIDRFDFSVLKYEDFVDGELEGLSDELGVPVTNPKAEGGAWLGHISRSRSYGNWRNWFTAADAEHFREEYRWFLERFEYDPDLGPLDDPVIDPDTSSEYVRRNRAERERTVDVRYQSQWDLQEVADRSGVARLEDMADDGDGVAAYRAALLYDEGRVVERDVDRAAELARVAALRGHRGSRRLLMRLLKQVGTPAARREGRYWRLVQEDESRMEALEQERDQATEELERIESSIRFQVAALFAGLFRDPFGEGRRRLRQLLQRVGDRLRRERGDSG